MEIRYGCRYPFALVYESNWVNNLFHDYKQKPFLLQVWMTLALFVCLFVFLFGCKTACILLAIKNYLRISLTPLFLEAMLETSRLKFASVSNKTSTAVLSYVIYLKESGSLLRMWTKPWLINDVIIQIKPLLALSHDINWFFNNLHKK